MERFNRGRGAESRRRDSLHASHMAHSVSGALMRHVGECACGCSSFHVGHRRYHRRTDPGPAVVFRHGNTRTNTGACRVMGLELSKLVWPVPTAHHASSAGARLMQCTSSRPIPGHMSYARIRCGFVIGPPLSEKRRAIVADAMPNTSQSLGAEESDTVTVCRISDAIPATQLCGAVVEEVRCQGRSM